jgi:ubiquinone/menaquinone biosynthesis C-methylase UbiE
MGFYQRHILPRLLDAAMGAEHFAKQRQKVVPRAEGRVLEIGFGSGHNLPFYDASKVSRIWALEPSAGMRARAEARVAASPIPLEFLDLEAEQIPLDDEAADTVLVTYSLCSIADVMKALAGMRRVLKRDGRMVFCEHGEAPDPGVKRWQQRLTPIGKAIGGGCHLGRPIPKLITDSGLRIGWMQTMYLPHTPRFAGFNYWGEARKS